MIRLCLILASLALVAAVLLALALPPTGTVCASVDIAASPTRVWAELADTAAWPAWNPEIGALHGPLIPAARIEIHSGSGNDEMVFTPSSAPLIRSAS